MIKRTATHWARDLNWLCAVVVVATCAIGVGSGHEASAAGVNGGPLLVEVPPGTAAEGQPLTSGGSATAFALTPPAGASCTGDSATGGYRVQSYIVPDSVDPSTLTFDSSGPIPQATGANLRLPLFSAVGASPFIDQTTAVETSPGSGGLLTGLPSFSFAAFGADGPAFVPPGTYNVGFACTLGPASATQQDKFWNVRLTFATDPADEPSGITWTLAAAGPPPTATTTTTTTPPTSTTTTLAVTPSSTSSTVVRSSSTSSTVVQSLGASPTGSSTSSLVSTGSSSVPLVWWGILLLVVGRIAILIGRRLHVAPRGKQ